MLYININNKIDVTDEIYLVWLFMVDKNCISLLIEKI